MTSGPNIGVAPGLPAGVAPGVERHEPGNLSRAGVLDVGLKCPHRCVFCYYSNLDGQDSAARKPFRPGDQCREIISEMARQGLTQFDLTGGEPSLHPDILSLIRHAASLGMATRLITLGQNLMTRHGDGLFVDALIDAGLTSFLFSVHAVDEAPFQAFTNASWARLRQAMHHLDGRGFQYCLNTVVFSGNQHLLPEIARVSASHGVYAHNFILFNPYYEWKRNTQAFAVQSRYAEARPYLVEAVDILERAGVAVNVRYAPLCAFPELHRNLVGVVGVLYDPHEWRNRAGNHDQPPAHCAEPLLPGPGGVRDIYALHHGAGELAVSVGGAGSLSAGVGGVAYLAQRGEDFKYFPQACAGCALLEACDGLDANLLQPGMPVQAVPFACSAQSGPILAARAAYAPAFLLKRGQFADMRSAMRQAFARMNTPEGNATEEKGPC